MNNHYVPQLLLKQFAVSNKVNVYDFSAAQFSTRKIRNTFAEQDLFDEELERLFATKLEGAFGDLLHHKLLKGEQIFLERKENLLIRKFFMINGLRSPYMNGTWEEIVAKTKMEDHPSTRTMEYLKRLYSARMGDTKPFEMSKEGYIQNLRKAMEIESLEKILDSVHDPEVSIHLRSVAETAIVSMIAFWDSSDSGQEFIYPKLQGISEMDQVSIFHKCQTLEEVLREKEKHGVRPDVQRQLKALFYGSMAASHNYAVYPISPTRILVKISPYFKVFFPIWPVDDSGKKEALFSEEQFHIHVYSPLRMSLFEPCVSFENQAYAYKVKQLTREEVCFLNAAALNMETEQFVFHEFNRIRESFWYYDHIIQFAQEKKYDFSNLE